MQLSCLHPMTSWAVIKPQKSLMQDWLGCERHLCSSRNLALTPVIIASSQSPLVYALSRSFVVLANLEKTEDPENIQQVLLNNHKMATHRFFASLLLLKMVTRISQHVWGNFVKEATVNIPMD